MKFERQKRLVERLLDKTRADLMLWEEALEEGAFRLPLSKNRIQISSVGNDRFRHYQIKISDEYDVTTDAFTDSDLDGDDIQNGRKWHSKLNELYDLSRRKSLNADEILDSILTEIG